MFELLFGLFWTVVTGVLFGAILASGEGGLMLWAVAAIFVGVGLLMIVIGLRKVVKNIATSRNGEEAYGIVVDLRPSGASVNGRPVLDAEVVIVEKSGFTARYVETVGTNYNKYPVGSYVFVKYYNDDINIISAANANVVPQSVKDKLASEGYGMNPNPYMLGGYMMGQMPYMKGGYVNPQASYMTGGYVGGQDPYMQTGYGMGQSLYMQGGYVDNQATYTSGQQFDINDPHYQVYNNGVLQKPVNNQGASDTVVIDGVEYVKKQ